MKKTSDIIPFCHPLPIESCKFTVEVLSEEALPQEIPILKDEICVRIGCSVRISGKTGKVEEMQAV